MELADSHRNKETVIVCSLLVAHWLCRRG